MFSIHGCSLEKVKEAANDLYKRAQKKYTEYHGGGDTPPPRPFTPQFQNPEGPKRLIISSECGYNSGVRYLYFATQHDSSSAFLAQRRPLLSSTTRLQPFWDVRYTNPISPLSSSAANHAILTGLQTKTGVDGIEIGTPFAQIDPAGSVVQSRCIDGQLTGGVIINLHDAIEQPLIYAGVQSTFAYHFNPVLHIAPWRSDGTGNLALQAAFKRPIYIDFSNNIGGGVYFNLFLRNRKNGTQLNIVIGLYAAGEAWNVEKRGIQFDPTTHIVHIATVASDASWWSTLSPGSRSILELPSRPSAKQDPTSPWNEFYRVNISYQNLLAILDELQKNPPPGSAGTYFGHDPSEWDLLAAMVQYELSEKGGKALLAGSFKDFKVFLSPYPF